MTWRSAGDETAAQRGYKVPCPPVSPLLAFPSELLCQNHRFPSTLLVHFLSPRLWLFFALLQHEVRKAD